jgi:hypothetical protein
MSAPTASPHRSRTSNRLAFSFLITLLAVTEAGAQASWPSSGRKQAAPRSTPPIAIAPSATGLFVLQGNGELFDFDLKTRSARPVFRTPAAYQAVEVTSVTRQNATIPCLTIYSQTRTTSNSWVLQLEGTEQRWAWLPERGLYVGMAWDKAAQRLYVANASTNSVYQLGLGNAPARYVGGVRGAAKVALLAHDAATSSLLAIDVEKPEIWRMNPMAKDIRSVLRLGEAGELRAAAWSQASRRLYLADSQKEAVWMVDLRAAKPRVTRLADPHFRDPAGVALAGGSLWVADEGAGALFELSPDGAFKAQVPWPPNVASVR